MEKYLVPLKSSEDASKRLPRREWRRSLVELTGRLDSKYRHQLFSDLFLHSYREVATFLHAYHVDGVPCRTQLDWINSSLNRNHQSPFAKEGISALQFDSKGIYLVSVTKSGCLTVHDFESLYCRSYDYSTSSVLEDDESKHVLHLSVDQRLDAVSWNATNQDEVACASLKSNEVRIFDIGYVSSEPAEVLRTKCAVTVHGSYIHKGLTDIAFTTTDKSRLFASDTNGVVNVWDRRVNSVPCIELESNLRSTLNSIQLNVENQAVFAAGRHGIIYMWDLRGGRGPAAISNHKKACHLPMVSWKLSSMLEKIGSLKAQSEIISKEVHSIDFDPSCPHQLAFHLDDGWSGVFNIYNLQVTHVHCPPPAWLDSSNTSADLLNLRKPSWLPTCSIYAVASSTHSVINLLDFYPDPTSPCHVDYSEDVENRSEVNIQNKRNRNVIVHERVTACAAHPLNGAIVAGTKSSSLLVVGCCMSASNQS